MIKKISAVADVRSGYSFRGAIKSSVGGKLSVVQAKDVEGLYVSNASVLRTDPIPFLGNYLNNGDVLLTSRGSFRAGIYQGDGSPAAATSALFTIRLATKDVLPEYLAIYLNSEVVQYHLRQSAKGATIQSVLIGDLKDLGVPCIPIDKQRLLIDLCSVIETQRRLLRQKQDIIGKILKNGVKQAVEGATR